MHGKPMITSWLLILSIFWAGVLFILSVLWGILFILSLVVAKRHGHRGHWWGKYALGLHALFRPIYLVIETFSSPLARLWTMPYQFMTLPLGLEIPLGTRIGRGLTLSHTSGVVIHTRAVLGNNCTIHSGVVIGGKGLGKAPNIGNNVYIGANAILVGDIRIGDNVTIGAGALVTNDIPTGILVGGNPMQVYKETYERPYCNYAEGVP